MWQVRKRAGNAVEAEVKTAEELRIVTVGDAGAFANRNTHTDLKVELHQRLLDVIELQALGPIEPLLKDPTITDILINGYSKVFVERYGVLEPTNVRFKDDRHLL